MARGVELATAYVSLAIETSGLGKQLGGQFKAAEGMAASSGKAMGQAVKKGLDSAKPVDLSDLHAKLESDEKKLAAVTEQTSRRRADASRQVEIAETRLREVKEKSNSTASQVLAAEDKVTRARQRYTDVSKQGVGQVQLYAGAVKDSSAKLKEAEAANKGLVDSAEKSKTAFGGLGDAIKSALKGDFKGAFSSIRGDAESAAGSVESEFQDAGEAGGKSITSGISGALDNLPGLIGAAGIGAAFAAGIGESMDQARLGDRLAAQLDLTGPQSEQAGKVAGSLYSGAYGESMGEVNDAIGAVMSSMDGMRGASEQDLERVTGYALDLASAFDVDVNEAVGSAGILMRNGLAGDADEAFDLITGAMQRVPAGFRDELMPAITEYGKHFGALGMDGEAAMGLLIRGAENGVIGVDKMGDAVKEFQIRATDMSKSTSSVYDTLGMDMQDMTNKLLAGGDTAEEAFGQIVAGLQGIDDPAARAEASIALFGTPLEDLGVDGIPQFLDALSPAAGEMDSFSGAAAKMGDTLNDNAATKVESFKRSLTQGFVEALGAVITALAPVGAALEPLFKFLVDTAPYWVPVAAGVAVVALGIGSLAAASTVAAIATTGFGVALAVLTSPITLVVAAIGLIVGALVLAYNKIGWFKTAVDWVWNGIKLVVSGVVNWFVATAVPIFQAAISVLGAVFTWLWANIIQPVWSWIRTIIANFGTWFITTLVPWIQAAVTVFGNIFRWLYTNVITPVWNGIKIVITVIVAAVVTIFQGLISFVRTYLGPAFSWFYHSIIIPVWNGIRAAISAAWSFIRDSIFTPIRNFITGPLANAFNWFYRSLIVPVWNGIRAAISGAWNFIRNSIFNPIRNFLTGPLANTFRWFRDQVIVPVWNGIKNSISSTWNWTRDNVLTPMINFVKNNVVSAWNTAKSGIDKAWTAIKGIVSKPVDFVINTVINDGFIKNFNKIADKVKIDKLPEIKFDGFARGGILPGRSSWRNGDDQLVPMRSGEGVYMSEVMSDPYERNRLHGMNDMVRRGMSPEQAREALDRNQDTSRHGVAAHGHAVGPGTQVFGGVDGPSYGNALQHAIARTGVLKVAGLAPSWNVGRAMGMWDGAAGVQVKSGGIGANHVRIQTGNYPDWWWGYYDNNNRIRLNSRTAGGQSSNIKTNIAAHEIGHALGLPHAMGWGKASVMDYGHLQSGGAVTANDIRELQKIYPGGTGQPGEGSSGFFSGMFEEFTKLVDLSKLLSGVPGAGFVPDLLKGAATMMWDGVKKFASSVFHDDSEEGGGEGAGRWAGTVREALGRVGLPTTAPYVDAWLRQIQTESGGNPRAVQGNIGDINNLTGDIAKGLVQVIGSTFQAHRDPELPDDRFNPLSSLVAGMRYAKARYGVGGMLSAIGRGHGYALGGIVDQVWDAPVGTQHALRPGLSTIYNGTGSTEHFQRVDTTAPGTGQEAHLHLHGAEYDESRMLRRGAEEWSRAFRKAGVAA